MRPKSYQVVPIYLANSSKFVTALPIIGMLKVCLHGLPNDRAELSTLPTQEALGRIHITSAYGLEDIAHLGLGSAIHLRVSCHDRLVGAHCEKRGATPWGLDLTQPLVPGSVS